MRRGRSFWKLAILVAVLLGVALSQSRHQTRSLVINGHSGQAIIYEIDGKSFLDLESLVRIGNGTMSFRGDQILLTFPPAEGVPAATSSGTVGMSNEFMRQSIQTVGILKEWTKTLAYAAQHGTPGDGSRLVVIHDRAAEALHLAKVAVSSDTDQNAFQLLSNQFSTVSAWSDKLVGERKSMDTGKYSMTENALIKDETYQKISNCAAFLTAMLSSGQFRDDYSCH